MAERIRDSWFTVGRPLPKRHSNILLALSFILPLLIWSIAAYGPFWDSEVEISLSSDADHEDFSTVYIPGDSMERTRFVAFQSAVREANGRMLETDTESSPASIRRANKRILRSLYPAANTAGWLDDTQEKDYAALYEVWAKIASGDTSAPISPENLEIIKENWSKLASVSPAYDSSNFYSQPIKRLIPEGVVKVNRPPMLPTPGEVLARASEDFSGNSKLGDINVAGRYLVSVRTVASGFIVACLIGIPVALLCGIFPFFSRLIEPFVDFFRYMPAPAFGTLLIAILGIYNAPKVALVVIGTLPHLILMVANTTRGLEPALIDAAQTLGANRQQLIRKVVIPGILPNLYNDLRILLGWAWTWLVISELLGVKAGLTELIDTQGRRFHFDHVYPVILLIGLTGFLTDQFLSWFRGVLFPYTGETVGTGARAVSRALRSIGSRKTVPSIQKTGATVPTSTATATQGDQ